MTDFFFNYGLFLAKTATIVIAIISVLLSVFIMAGRKQTAKRESFEIKKLNKKYDDMAMATPAIVGDRLLIRTSARLYCIQNSADGVAETK